MIVREAQAADFTAYVSCSIFSVEMFIFIADYKDVTPDNPGTRQRHPSLAPGVMESTGVEGMETSVAILPQKYSHERSLPHLV